ncbi:hypothetical protein RI367_004714 [Sorochytrium milnesiophthora]
MSTVLTSLKGSLGKAAAAAAASKGALQNVFPAGEQDPNSTPTTAATTPTDPTATTASSVGSSFASAASSFMRTFSAPGSIANMAAADTTSDDAPANDLLSFDAAGDASADVQASAVMTPTLVSPVAAISGEAARIKELEAKNRALEDKLKQVMDATKSRHTKSAARIEQLGSENKQQQTKIDELQAKVNALLKTPASRLSSKSSAPSSPSHDSPTHNAGEVDALKAENQRLTAQLHEVQTKLAATSAPAQTAEADNGGAAAQRRVDDLEMLVASLKQQLSEAQMDNTTNAQGQNLAKLNAELQQRNDELDAKIASLQTQLQASTVHADEQSAFVVDLRSQIDTLATARVDKDAEIAQLQARVGELTSTNADTEQKLATLTEDLTHKTAEADALSTTQQQLEAQTAEIASLRQTIADLQSHGHDTVDSEGSDNVIRQLREQLAAVQLEQKEGGDQDEEIKRLKQEIEELREQRPNDALQGVEALKSELETRTVQIADLQQQQQLRTADSATELEKVRNQHQTELATVQEQVQSLTQQLGEAQTKRAEADKRIAQLQKENERFTVLDQQLKASLVEAADKESALADQVKSLQDELAAAKQALAAEADKSNKSVTLLRSTRRQYDVLGAEKTELESELAKIKNERSSLTDQLTRKNAELLAADKRNAQQTTRIQRLESQAGNAEALNKRLAELTASETKLGQDLTALQRQLAEKTEALDLAVDQVQSLKSRMAMLTEELSTSKSLFATKSGEADTLRMRVSELESAFDDFKITSQRQLAESITHSEAAKAQLRTIADRSAEAVDTMRDELLEAKRVADDAAAARASVEAELAGVCASRDSLEHQLNALRGEIQALQDNMLQSTEDLRSARASEVDLSQQHISISKERDTLAQQLEEAIVRETHLKQMNRSLKDELRKLAKSTGSSSQLTISPSPSSSNMARLSFDHGSAPSPVFVRASSPVHASPSRPPINTVGLAVMTAQPPRSPGAGSTHTMESAMNQALDQNGNGNVDYLRYVLLSFLEKRAMRKQLVPVLSTLLKCSPEETAKLKTHVQL